MTKPPETLISNTFHFGNRALAFSLASDGSVGLALSHDRAVMVSTIPAEDRARLADFLLGVAVMVVPEVQASSSDPMDPLHRFELENKLIDGSIDARDGAVPRYAIDRILAWLKDPAAPAPGPITPLPRTVPVYAVGDDPPAVPVGFPFDPGPWA